MAAALNKVFRFGTFFSHLPVPQTLFCRNIPRHNACVLNRFYSRKFSHTNYSTWRKLALCGAATVGTLASAVALGQLTDAGTTKVTAKEDTSKRHKWNFIADVVEKTAPAVVYIELKGRHPFANQMVTMSNGSGFIVREDGLILTNAHVVANKQSVLVKLKDGRSFDGVVQAVDPVSDLATVKIKANNLPTIALGDSSGLRPGEWVVALGSPFQLSNTVTAGIVSTVNRGSKELGLRKDMDYIQTDAVINFGNSGGPLVNLDGEAIGINTMKVTTGISFAIPSDYAKQFLLKARELEKTRSRSWFGAGSGNKQRYIGITMVTLTPDIVGELRAREAEIPVEAEQGVLIRRVTVGSPAHTGGIRPGDIITAINQKPVRSARDVYEAVSAGDTLHVTLSRHRQTLELTVIPETVQ